MPYFGAPDQMGPRPPVARQAVFVGRKRCSVAYPGGGFACAVVFMLAFIHLETI
jgi:hypothetical protein